MTTKTNVEFENDRVRVTRVQRSGPGAGSVPSTTRQDRLIIYLRDGHIDRQEGGRHEALERRAGQVVWRERSQHEVAVAHDGEHEVLIVELKS